MNAAETLSLLSQTSFQKFYKPQAGNSFTAEEIQQYQRKVFSDYLHTGTLNKMVRGQVTIQGSLPNDSPCPFTQGMAAIQA